MRHKILGLLAAGVMATAGFAATTTKAPATDGEIAHKVAKEVRMYTRYTIWDNVNLRVNNGEVQLLGEVSQPWKKKDIERLAQSVPGVTSVTNELKVLPLSGFDNDLRLRIARAVYGHPSLSRYAIQAVPPIHIIVDNGHVKLEGVVNNEMEKTIAGIQAGTAGLSFGAVENNLRVENPSRKNG